MPKIQKITTRQEPVIGYYTSEDEHYYGYRAGDPYKTGRYETIEDKKYVFQKLDDSQLKNSTIDELTKEINELNAWIEELRDSTGGYYNSGISNQIANLIDYKKKLEDTIETLKQASINAALNKEREQADSSVKETIKKFQTYLKDPDNQSPEDQELIKNELKNLYSQISSIGDLQKKITNLEELISKEATAKKFEFRAQKKQFESELQKLIQQIDNETTQIEAKLNEAKQIKAQNFLLEQKRIDCNRWKILANIK